MSKFTLPELIYAFSELGKQLTSPNEELQNLIQSEHNHNAWFTPESVEQALNANGQMLNAVELEKWLNRYDLQKSTQSKKVGLILAGNIPLVGFHDVLCVLATGN